MLNPMFELVEGDLEQLLHAGRLVPARAHEGAHGARCAPPFGTLDTVAEQMSDPVPPEVAALHGSAHSPTRCARSISRTPRRSPRRGDGSRSSQLFQLQMVMELPARARGGAARSRWRPERTKRVRESLPFTLTADQDGAIAEISADLARPRPMHRLVIGDVGSGKTVVALMAAAQALEAGHQVAFMAPTEVLARQHATSLSRSRPPRASRVATTTGAIHRGAAPAAQRAAGLGRAAAAGRHALLEDKGADADAAPFAIVTSSPFGVKQRDAREEGRAAAPARAHRDAHPAHAAARVVRRSRRERHPPPSGGTAAARHARDGLREVPSGRAVHGGRARGRRQAFVVVPAIEEAASSR